jgi:hypothetical protein
MKIKTLYTAINHVVASIGMNGAIDSRSELIEELKDALFAIDGGVYKPELFDETQSKFTQLQAEVEALQEILNYAK